MNNKSFQAIDGLKLIVTHRRSAVIFEIENPKKENDHLFRFEFTEDVFQELLEHLEYVSSISWDNIDPREADSQGSDFYEYYDRKLDNNGYLTLYENALVIEKPCLESNKLYQFNKRKMESFIYELRRAIKNDTRGEY